MSTFLIARNRKNKNAIDSYNEIMKETCICLCVEYIDSSPMLLSDAERIRQDLYFDIIHLNNKGHILFAEELNKFILNSIVTDADEKERQSTDKSTLKDESDTRNLSQIEFPPLIKNCSTQQTFSMYPKKTPHNSLEKPHLHQVLNMITISSERTLII